ncbi:unnamed protein product, partial [Ectocarpus fasciculatus]
HQPSKGGRRGGGGRPQDGGPRRGPRRGSDAGPRRQRPWRWDLPRGDGDRCGAVQESEGGWRSGVRHRGFPGPGWRRHQAHGRLPRRRDSHGGGREGDGRGSRRRRRRAHGPAGAFPAAVRAGRSHDAPD